MVDAALAGGDDWQRHMSDHVEIRARHRGASESGPRARQQLADQELCPLDRPPEPISTETTGAEHLGGHSTPD
jgi:hypothetical protein